VIRHKKMFITKCRLVNYCDPSRGASTGMIVSVCVFTSISGTHVPTSQSCWYCVGVCQRWWRYWRWRWCWWCWCTWEWSGNICTLDTCIHKLQFTVEILTTYHLTGFRLWNRKPFLNSVKGFRSYTPCFLLLVVVITCTAWPQPSLDTGDGPPQLPHNYLDLPIIPQGPTIETCQQTEMAGRWVTHSQVCPHQRRAVPRQPTPDWLPPTDCVKVVVSPSVSGDRPAFPQSLGGRVPLTGWPTDGWWGAQCRWRHKRKPVSNRFSLNGNRLGF